MAVVVRVWRVRGAGSAPLARARHGAHWEKRSDERTTTKGKKNETIKVSIRVPLGLTMRGLYGNFSWGVLAYAGKDDRVVKVCSCNWTVPRTRLKALGFHMAPAAWVRMALAVFVDGLWNPHSFHVHIFLLFFKKTKQTQTRTFFCKDRFRGLNNKKLREIENQSFAGCRWRRQSS